MENEQTNRPNKQRGNGCNILPSTGIFSDVLGIISEVTDRKTK